MTAECMAVDSNRRVPAGRRSAKTGTNGTSQPATSDWAAGRLQIQTS